MYGIWLIYLSAYFNEAATDMKKRINEVENLTSDILSQSETDTVINLQQEAENNRSRKEYIVQHLRTCRQQIWDLVNVSMKINKCSMINS